ncbi:bifunctional adenosylcobinamide kinase/adenosylcobinamide-phosphate guanylyltransferase [soil metagenome]
MIVLFLGGARSGKSVVAERRAAESGTAVTYLATAVPAGDDADFAARIAAHQARRPPTWTTVEVGAALAEHLRDLDGTALVDSLGTWVANHDAFEVDGRALVDAMTGRSGDTIVVSEEVGLGVHPSSEAGRRFRDALGALNQVVAEAADDVLLVVAGRVLPLERSR